MDDYYDLDSILAAEEVCWDNVWNNQFHFIYRNCRKYLQGFFLKEKGWDI